MHPFSPDFSTITDTELDNKLTELAKKINIANRSGNYNLIHQMQLLYNDYLEERAKRDQAKLQEMLKANNRDFDDIIDIG